MRRWVVLSGLRWTDGGGPVIQPGQRLPGDRGGQRPPGGACRCRQHPGNHDQNGSIRVSGDEGNIAERIRAGDLGAETDIGHGLPAEVHLQRLERIRAHHSESDDERPAANVLTGCAVDGRSARPGVADSRARQTFDRRA